MPSPTRKKVGLRNGMLYIVFPPSMHTAKRVRTLRNCVRRTQPAPHWEVAATADNVRTLKKWGFACSPQVSKLIEEVACAVVPYHHLDFSCLHGTPYPYQKEAIAFAQDTIARAGGVLLADEMGLGKTIEAIGWMGLNPVPRPALVVCTATLKPKWVAHVRDWLPGETVHMISGRWDGVSSLPPATVYVINYDIMAHVIERVCGDCGGAKKIPAINPHTKEVMRTIKCVACKGTGLDKPIIKPRGDVALLRPQVVITDECQALKNWKTQQTKAVIKVMRPAPHRIAISGTPIENKPIEFYTVLGMLAPKLFANYNHFTRTYCDAKNNGFGMDTSGASNIDELHKLLKESVMIRRLKKNVLKELPPKRREVVPLEIDNRAEYNRAQNNFLGWIKGKAGLKGMAKAAKAMGLTKTNHLKQLAVQGKMKAVLAWLHEFLETEQKVVVFCHHKITVDALMKGLAQYHPVKVDGGVTGNKREAAITLFQTTAAHRVFVGTKAACEGIDLTAAAYTVTTEFWWNPSKHLQAEDRVHRIGQEAQSIGAIYLVALDTIEVDIAGIINEKDNVVGGVLDGKEQGGEDMLNLLMSKMLKGDK